MKYLLLLFLLFTVTQAVGLEHSDTIEDCPKIMAEFTTKNEASLGLYKKYLDDCQTFRMSARPLRPWDQSCEEVATEKTKKIITICYQ